MDSENKRKQNADREAIVLQLALGLEVLLERLVALSKRLQQRRGNKVVAVWENLRVPDKRLVNLLETDDLGEMHGAAVIAREAITKCPADTN